MQQQEMTVSQFYKVVASKLGIFGEKTINGKREITSACLAEYDKLIKHEANLEVFIFTTRTTLISKSESNNIYISYFSLKDIQGFHVDTSPNNIRLVDGTVQEGSGPGFSAFLGLSTRNSMWIASLNESQQLVDEKRIIFGEGDILILPFGTIHAGDRNRTGSVTYKLFTELFTKTKTNTQSQLWVVNGQGFSRNKQECQLTIA